ncbi:hypothetical protein MXB_402 [Myxobolus squamalis]|nr:hypothetical protein MXB_402 [Myxobolus squamalis]
MDLFTILSEISSFSSDIPPISILPAIISPLFTSALITDTGSFLICASETILFYIFKSSAIRLLCFSDEDKLKLEYQILLENMYKLGQFYEYFHAIWNLYKKCENVD